MTIIHTEQSHIQSSSTSEREMALKIPEPVLKKTNNNKKNMLAICVFDFELK